MRIVISVVLLLCSIYSFGGKKDDLVGKYQRTRSNFLFQDGDTITSNLVLLGNDSFYIVDIFRVIGKPNDVALNLRKGKWTYHKDELTLKFDDGKLEKASFDFFDTQVVETGQKEPTVDVEIGNTTYRRDIKYYCDPVPDKRYHN